VISDAGSTPAASIHSSKSRERNHVPARRRPSRDTGGKHPIPRPAFVVTEGDLAYRARVGRVQGAELGLGREVGDLVDGRPEQGRGRTYTLAAQVYARHGQRAEYTRQAGFDRLQ
jgi:hypothetical protein